MNTNGAVDEKWASGLAAWRAAQLHEVVLPSGLTVQLKRASLEDLVIGGGIPDTLSSLVGELMEGNEFKMGANKLNEMIGIFNVVVRACMVNPPVADRPSDTHIGIDEISFADKQAIFDWANGDAKALRPFRGERKEQTDAGSPAPDGEGVRTTAEFNSGDSEQLDGVPV